MATADQLTAFIKRQRYLLVQEREAEIKQSALLLTNCGPKLLEQKSLAILGLGVASMGIGLGGKRYVGSPSCVNPHNPWGYSLIELEHPAAYNSSPLFPPHNFR